MRKMITTIFVVFFLCFVSISSAKNWSNNWEFNYTEGDYEPTDFTSYISINFNALVNVTSSEIVYITISFSALIDVTMSPVPATFSYMLNFSALINVTEPAATTSNANSTVNYSAFTEEINSTLFGYMKYNESNYTTCWFQWKNHSLDYTTPDGNVSVGIIGQGSTFSTNASGLSNGSLYYFRTRTNNSNGWNNSWNSSYLLTKPQPATSIAITNISGGFNITWNHGIGYNLSLLVRSDDHYPQTVIDGLQVYSGSNNFYPDTSLVFGTVYYYRVWEYTYWDNPALEQYSDGNISTRERFIAYSPVFSNESPLNTSIGVSVNVGTWNVTMTTYVDLFNWTIQSSLGSNQSNFTGNGSKRLDFGVLGYSQLYTIWVNATTVNTSNVSRAIYYFIAEESTIATYSTKNFSGYLSVTGFLPVITLAEPTNGSTNLDLYPWLNITVTEPQLQNFNISWSTNFTGTWKYWNSTCTSGGTYRQRATFANTSDTTYWWTVKVNDTDGYWTNATYHFSTNTYNWSDWSDWWNFNYTCCGPTNLEATAYNQTAINLTWDLCSDGADKNHLTRNVTGWSHYPLSPSNGTVVYNGTNVSFNDTGLLKGTTYYYTIWGYNITNNNYSIFNESAAATTNGDVVLASPYPANTSTENTRPPVNISINITGGTNVNLSIYFYNMTPVPASRTWIKLYNWSGVTIGRYAVTNLSTLNGTTQFSWGNTRYNWSVNATDGTSWLNYSYYYTTISSASGSNARYDVNNNGVINSIDLSFDWAHRTSSYDYDGLYDVNENNVVNAIDLSYIWANRSS